MLRRSPDSRIHLALKEHARLTRELAELHRRPSSDPQLVAALRMCRATIERQLRHRGWHLARGEWRRISAA